MSFADPSILIVKKLSTRGDVSCGVVWCAAGYTRSIDFEQKNKNENSPRVYVHKRLLLYRSALAHLRVCCYSSAIPISREVHDKKAFNCSTPR